VTIIDMEMNKEVMIVEEILMMIGSGGGGGDKNMESIIRNGLPWTIE
jgi:hypothetical protein